MKYKYICLEYLYICCLHEHDRLNSVISKQSSLSVESLSYILNSLLQFRLYAVNTFTLHYLC